MSDGEVSTGVGDACSCFLPERRFFRTISRATQEALLADSETQTVGAFWSLIDSVDYNDDIEEATRLAMRAELSGAEAEGLARAIRCLGATSVAEVVRDLRVSYAACVSEHHAMGRASNDEYLLPQLALQLVDPIRSLTSPTATFATAKALVELLSFVGLEVDAWQAVLWIRVLHPRSRVGAAAALRSLAADCAASREAGPRPKVAVELESQAELGRRQERTTADEPSPSASARKGST